MKTSLDPENYLEQLASATGLDFKKVMDHFAAKQISFIEEMDIPYFRFRKMINHVEEGTVAFIARETGKVEVVRGFPKIRRALVLDSAIKKHLPEKFFAEEKMDGYNVRTVMVGGNILSITKGGIVCPYTTEHIAGKINKKFFEENPNLALCGEVVGLQNPFQMKSYPEADGFGYFIFDIRNRITGTALPIEEKQKMLVKYSLPSVRSFGLFSKKDGWKLLQTVRELGENGREGVVMKDPQMKTMVKYTSNQNTNRDLQYAFQFFSDYGQAFFFRRLVREAFQCYELDMGREDLKKEAQRLGEAILIPMVETIRRIAEGKEVTEDFEIAVPDPEFGKMFVNHLNHLGVKATVEEVRKDGGNYVLKVKRHYPSTNDKTKAYLNGEFCGE